MEAEERNTRTGAPAEVAAGVEAAEAAEEEEGVRRSRFLPTIDSDGRSGPAIPSRSAVG